MQPIVGEIFAAQLLTDDIMALDIHTVEPFVYVEGQNADLIAEINGETVSRGFSLAGTMDADATQLARFMIRHNSDGVFTNWLFEHLNRNTIIGLGIKMRLRPMCQN